MNYFLFVSFFCSLILFIEWNAPVRADSHQAEKQKIDPCFTNSYDISWWYTVKLLKSLIKEAEYGENILISPVGTYIALELLYTGAGERTRKEFDKILFPEYKNRFNLTPSDIHAHLSSVRDNFRGHASNSWGNSSKVEIADGIFLQKDFPIVNDFKRYVELLYNGIFANVDYHKANETTDLINKWISENTDGRISKFFDQPIDTDTVALLINAVYFKGTWENTFTDSSTKIEKFNTGTAEINVPMMRNVHVVKYQSIPLLQAEVVVFDYADRNATMYIFLAYRSQSLKNLTDHLHLFDILEFRKKAKYTWVDYKIPKMKFNWKKSLVNALNARAIFKNPDLSQMTTKSVKILDMLHATEIEVDENGTTASGVTNIHLKTLGAAYIPNKKLIQFYVDRPFYMQILGPYCEMWFSGLVHKPI